MRPFIEGQNSLTVSPPPLPPGPESPLPYQFSFEEQVNVWNRRALIKYYTISGKSPERNPRAMLLLNIKGNL